MSFDKKQAFTGRANVYQQARPNYPAELFLHLINFWHDKTALSIEQPLVADIGCGTGIASRGIYAAFNGECKVIGVEPGHDMRKTAIAATPAQDNIEFLEGSAEVLPFANASLDIIMAAQAIQWFDRPRFYAEASRTLKTTGVVAIIENNRDYKTSKFLDEYEKFLELHAHHADGTAYSRHYRERDYKAELHTYFSEVIQIAFTWVRHISPHDFLAMAKSSTQAQRAMKNLGAEKAEQAILALALAQANQAGQLEIPYVSLLYAAKNKLNNK